MNFVLLLVSIFFSHQHRKMLPICAGCPNPILNTNDAYVVRAARFTTDTYSMKFKRVLGGTSQVVSGIRYKMDIEIEGNKIIWVDIICREWEHACEILNMIQGKS